MSEVYYDYEDTEEPYYPRRRRLKHSGLGVASLIIAVLTGLLELIVLAVAAVMAARNPEGIDENSPAAMLVGLLMMAGVASSLVGAVLGVAGLVQERRSKVLPVLGLGLNLIVAMGVLGIICVGILLPD